MAPPRAADNFGQRQPITTAIKTICLYYPPNTCLRELLQNADDAGATEIEYVLDTNTYGDEQLLHEGLRSYQGPALLARNDSVFRDEDFDSLSSVGDSVKKNDPASTGKFGQGFNAVYHWTDGPWVYSRNWLLLLDPHEWWSPEVGQPGGPRWDVVTNHDCEEIQNHLRTFSGFGLDYRVPLDQTIIRIPLRTAEQAAQSKIFHQKVEVQAIRQALEDFGREMSEGGLLFLKSVKKIIIRLDSDLLLEAEILETREQDTRIRKELPTKFKELYVSPSPRNTEDIFRTFELDIRHTERGVSKVHHYAVQHEMLRTSGNDKMDMWARERKLFPWVAIAAPLLDHSRDEAVPGRLFTILRLPMPTNLPVHVHGLFCVAPDRGRLDFTRGSDDLATLWNTFMFEKCVTRAWVELLTHRNNKSWQMEGFDFWPKPNLIAVESVAPWYQLDDSVIDMVIHQKRKVWNAFNRSCADIDSGFFARKDEDATRYGPALAQFNVPAVFLEESLFGKLKERARLLGKGFRMLEPQTIRRFLRWKKLPQVSEDISSLMLEFCLLDAIRSPLEADARSGLYNDLEGIQLWPTLAGRLSIPRDKVDLLLPRDEAEMQLFANSRAASTVDLSKLSPTVRKTLLKDIQILAAVMRFRDLDDLAIDWPSMYPIAMGCGNSPGLVKRPHELDEILGSVWGWISKRIQDGQRIDTALSANLWLIPLNDARLRRYEADSGNLPVLIIEQRDPLFDLLEVAVSRDPPNAPPLLNTTILPADAVKLIRTNKDIRADTKCACIDDPSAFVDWLVAGKQMLSTISDEDKHCLLSHLEVLTRDRKLLEGPSSSLITQMRRLPLYNKVSCCSPFKEVTYVRSSLDGEKTMYETPSGLPPLPEIPNVSFFNPRNLVEKALVDRLKALKKLPVKEILTRLILPWMNSPSMSTNDELRLSKDGLIEWIMSKAPTTHSPPWQTEVFTHAIIPVLPLPAHNGKRLYRCLAGMVDPTSDLAQLYDEEEELFPCREFFTKHGAILVVYGILSKPIWSTPLYRVRYFSQQGHDIDVRKIQRLLKLPVSGELLNARPLVAEIRGLKWLQGISTAGSLVMLAPNECRGADESHLVDLVWGTTTLFVRSAWKKLLGWNEKISTDVLLRQLDGCLSRKHYEKVDLVLSQIDPNDSFELLTRPCIPGRSGERFIPAKVFFPGKWLNSRPLAPYLDGVDANFARKHENLLRALKIKREPLIQDLKMVQDALVETFGDQLGPAGIGIAIATLEIATRLRYDTTDLLVPDTTSALRELKDIVHGDPLETGETPFNFTHPEISADLISRLGIQDCIAKAIELNIDLDSEDENDYTPKESLETKISDTLERYPITTTFNEFLANADDAKATRIVWTLDECKDGSHASSSLMTTELKSLQGPALFVHNDGSFSKQDFVGFKEIGKGGKQEDDTSNGMFGMGALSMYHFTDVPMLVSADSFVALDPQQRVLPMNYSRRRKRRAGIKMSVKAVKRMAPDQLSPFVGLHGFDDSADSYDGTTFRFPLRTIGAKTTLKDTSPQMDLAGVKSLLEVYFASARTVLLFLRNVESIEFHIRGQETPQWTVSAKRAKSGDETFRRIDITSSRAGSEVRVDTWAVGVKEVTEIPKGIARSGKGSKKATECGVAACLLGRKKTVEDGISHSLLKPVSARVKLAQQPTVPQNVFCRLPTGHESSLPISIHASFAVTGDRRSIPLEDTAENSGWNRWLLESCVSAIYVEMLIYLAPRLGPRAFDLWPKEESRDTFSGVLSKAFWERVRTQCENSSRLLPLISQDTSPNGKEYATVLDATQKTTDLRNAVFDFMPETISETLRPLFLQTIPFIVRPPRQLWLDFMMPSPRYQLDSDCLCRTFKVETNCRLLEAFVTNLERDDDRTRVMALLLRFMIPAPDDVATALSSLDGCRVIPRPLFWYPFGSLVWKPRADTIWNYFPTPEEQQLFYFAADRMINNQLYPQKPATSVIGNGHAYDPIERLLNADFNVRRLEIGDMGPLLALPQSPTTSLKIDVLANWMPKFWQYINAKFGAIRSSVAYPQTHGGMNVGDLLTKAGLHDKAVYRTFSQSQWRYLTPRQFETQACVIKPANQEHRKVCDQIDGLFVIDRDCVPFLLQEEEDNLAKAASFRRLLRALGVLEKTTRVSARSIVGNGLTTESKRIIRKLSLSHLSASNYRDTPMDAVIRRLPIWPRSKPSNTSPVNHIAAEDAIFCRHKQMLMPWVRNLPKFVEPQLVDTHGLLLSKMGVDLLTQEQVWHLIKSDLPTDLRPAESRSEYVKFIRYLANSGVRPLGKVAPNGSSVMCETDTIYDHQDEIFMAAFREEKTTRFLHKDMQGAELRSFWLSIGLRARPSTRVMSSDHYVECAHAINRRGDPTHTDGQYTEDARVITAYLGYDRPEFRSWTTTAWAQITTIAMFAVRGVDVDEFTYRQPRMDQIAREKTHCTLRDSCRLAYKRVIWSRSRFLISPPGAFVYEKLPLSGEPAAAQVFQHLQFLMAMITDVSQGELPEFLRDVQACYEHLQADLYSTKSIPGVREAPIWLNLDTTQVDLVVKDYLESYQTSAKYLCLNCPVDPLPIRNAGNFLIPYEKLLAALGCKAVVQPRSSTPPPSSDERERSLVEAMSAMASLRDQGQLVDVIFEAEGQQKPAHRLVLAAVSDYCKGQFAGHWGKQLADGAIVRLEDISFLTLSQMVDFAYSGVFNAPVVRDDKDNDEIEVILANLLDLLHGTDMWLLQRLHDLVESFLMHKFYVRVDTVKWVKEKAESARASRLVEYCKDFWNRNEDFVKAMDDED